MRAWKKIEREQVLKWEVSEGHVSDFLNAMRQHGGGFSRGWRSGEASLMAYTSDERSWSPWKRERNNSEGGGKGERERSHQHRGSGWHVFKLYDTVFKRLEGSRKTAHRSGIISEHQHHFCCVWLSDMPEKTLWACQCLPGTLALHQNVPRWAHHGHIWLQAELEPGSTADTSRWTNQVPQSPSAFERVRHQAPRASASKVVGWDNQIGFIHCDYFWVKWPFMEVLNKGYRGRHSKILMY